MDEGNTVIDNFSESLAPDINPPNCLNVRGLKEFFVIGLPEVLFALNRPTDCKMVVWHLFESLQRQV
jgi:hypothetical protein